MFHVILHEMGYTMEWYMQLVVNDEPVMNLSAWKPYNTSDSLRRQVGASMCVVHCTSGNQVCVRLSYTSVGAVGIYGGHYTTFSGFLLHANVCM